MLKVSSDKRRSVVKSLLGRVQLMRATAAALVSTAALLIPALPPSALVSSTDPYISNSLGYDVSYPQCTNKTSYASGEFAIIGISDGRPFTTNPCVKTLWNNALSAKATSISFYINTGNSGAYAKDITSDCATAVPVSYTTRQAKQSWEIGCSEAEYSIKSVANIGLSPYENLAPGTTGNGMWWADVETGNSWSANTNLNRDTIQGLMFELANLQLPTAIQETGLPVGIYSNVNFWDSITGGGGSGSSWMDGSNADWYAGSTCNNFDGNPAWVVQYVLSTATGMPSPIGDSDTAC